ncbi:hypothetical protein TcG_12874 [Trypanosoma cruzi]|nr:hypothetical protein TcG_12874 [Trypanosoma cruzi]
MLARHQPSYDAVDLAAYLRNRRACMRRGSSGGPLREVGASRWHGVSASRKKSAGHHSVGSACRQVIMRLFHLRVKLSSPIRNVRDGVGVVGAQTLPFQQ